MTLNRMMRRLTSSATYRNRATEALMRIAARPGPHRLCPVYQIGWVYNEQGNTLRLFNLKQDSLKKGLR